MSEPDAERQRAIEEEQGRLRELRMVVDLTANVIAQGGLEPAEARRLVAAARQRALALFPEGASTWELVLAPRFARLVREHAADPWPAGPRPSRLTS